MTKGRNTFEGYQTAKQDSRAQLIIQYLEHLKTSRVKFQHVTGLAEMAAKHIAHQEGRPCNRATLLRNNRYKALLLTFMAAHLGAGTKFLKLKDVTDEKAKVLVTTAQLEAGNLKRECDRLRTYIEHLEKSQRPTTIRSDDTVSKLQRESMHDMQMKYTRTCQALFSLLKSLDGMLVVDPETKQIRDKSRLRNNVVVDATLAEPFFEWLQLNSGVPGGISK